MIKTDDGETFEAIFDDETSEQLANEKKTDLTVDFGDWTEI